MSKTKVIVLYGGKSTEHEISCRSAAFVFSHLDRSRYEVIPVAISKQGQWIPQNEKKLLDQVKSSEGSVAIDTTLASQPSLPTNPDTQRAFLSLAGNGQTLFLGVQRCKSKKCRELLFQDHSFKGMNEAGPALQQE